MVPNHAAPCGYISNRVVIVQVTDFGPSSSDSLRPSSGLPCNISATFRKHIGPWIRPTLQYWICILLHPLSQNLALLECLGCVVFSKTVQGVLRRMPGHEKHEMKNIATEKYE